MVELTDTFTEFNLVILFYSWVFLIVGTVPAPQTDSSYWTAVPGITNNNTSAPYRAIFYKFATGSSITATFTSTNVGYAMLAYRFVDSSTPFDVNVTSNSSSGMPNCPSITPVSDKSLIIAAGFLMMIR